MRFNISQASNRSRSSWSRANEFIFIIEYTANYSTAVLLHSGTPDPHRWNFPVSESGNPIIWKAP